MQNPTVGEYLLGEIKRLGITEVFGIPGDLIIKFFKLIETDPNMKLYTFSHEPAVGFAAIGAARAKQKPAVACVTYGPGALGLLNSVACAYAEKTPLIVVAGGLPVSLRQEDFSMHHTVKGYDTQLNVYSQITVQAVVLDNLATAQTKISKALKACQDNMLPVYIEVPADMVNATITASLEQPDFPQTLASSQLSEATDEILLRFSKAEKPVLMIGVEAVRFGLVSQIVKVAEKLRVPVVSTMLARDSMPRDSSSYCGVYLGKAGNPEANELVGKSDLILLLGEGFTDVNFGQKLAHLRAADIVRCVSGQVKTNVCTHQGVPLENLVSNLSKATMKPKMSPEITLQQTNLIDIKAGEELPLVTDDIIDAVNLFFDEFGEMPVISDTGDCLFATLRLRNSSIIGSSFYGTMGFAAPAAIGYAVTSKKRPLVLIGDGAFQMTGQEICHCKRYGINPIFIVNNNRSWGMEQMFHTSAINDLVSWPYAQLAVLWGGKGYLCNTSQEFWEALIDAKEQRTFSLIEVKTDGKKPSVSLMAYVSEQK